jgi:hypothetical protein
MCVCICVAILCLPQRSSHDAHLDAGRLFGLCACACVCVCVVASALVARCTFRCWPTLWPLCAQVLSLRRCAHLSDEAISAITRCGRLQHLAVSNVHAFGPFCMAGLASCCQDSLEYLDISFCRCAPAAVLCVCACASVCVCVCECVCVCVLMMRCSGREMVW